MQVSLGGSFKMVASETRKCGDCCCDRSSLKENRSIMGHGLTPLEFSSTLESCIIAKMHQRLTRCTCKNYDEEKRRFTLPDRHVKVRTSQRFELKTFVQILILLQSMFLVTSQAFPVGCHWRSSISPTMPEFQRVRLLACDTGRLTWHIPYVTRRVEVTFQEGSSRGPFQICLEYLDSKLNDIMQVTDETDKKGQLITDFPAGEEVCVQSGQDYNVVINFILKKTEIPANSPNDIDYSVIKNTRQILVNFRRERS